MKIYSPLLAALRGAARGLPVAAGLASSGILLAASSPWTPLHDPTPGAVNGGKAPGGVQMLLLLPDGTVMAQQAPSGTTIRNAWYRLTPDIHGSYVNGTWTTRAPMNEQRLFYSSAVLRSGQVFVAGGEYTSNGTRQKRLPNDIHSATAEIYDPVLDQWTMLPAVPASWSTPGRPFAFGDSICSLLPDGNVLIGPVFGHGNRSAIYDVVGNTWLDGPAYFSGAADTGNQNEASWLKLPDDSILTISALSTASQRYLPAPIGQWVQDAGLPYSLYSNVGGEIGSAHLLPEGNRALFIGANGNTALYLPSGNANQGSWIPGPAIPNVIKNTIGDQGNVTGTNNTTGAAPDAPAAMLPNGRLLCAFSGQLYNDPRAGTAVSRYWTNQTNPQYPEPTSFYEYDPVAQAFNPLPGPTGQTDEIPAFRATMLILPDGGVLYSNYGDQLYLYNSGGTPVPAGKPAIARVTPANDGSYHLTGTGLNGISAGASYGDDAQMDTNFPLVKLSDEKNGYVYYARTYNWSSTGVRTRTNLVSTEFVLPPALLGGGGGTYSLAVVANGIASDPVSFAGEVWVDFRHPLLLPEIGSIDFPYRTFGGGTHAIGRGGVLHVKAGHGNETVSNLGKPMTIRAYGGAVTIGNP